MILLVSFGMIFALLAYFFVRVRWHKQADATAKAGQLDEALAQYARILKYYPQDAIAMHNRAVAYRHKGDFEAALAELNRAVARGGRMSAMLRINRAYLQMYLGNHMDALADYRLALHAEPNQPQALLGIVYTHIFTKDYETALQEAEKTIAQIEIDKAKSEKYGAYILTQTPETQKQVYRVYEAIYTTKAIALAHLGRGDEAKVIFDQLKIQNPTSSQVFVDSGEVHFLLGDYATAKTDFERAMLVEIENPLGVTSMRGYPFIYYAQAGYAVSLFAVGEVEDAHKQLSDLQAKAPRLITAQDMGKE
ncbi:MAG: tetratricopeptide repeat protein, partial [Anaerolineae bacterium]|nr:tetratricopeptide repeat protein [Anaerolineae bacterium]